LKSLIAKSTEPQSTKKIVGLTEKNIFRVIGIVNETSVLPIVKAFES